MTVNKRPVWDNGKKGVLLCDDGALTLFQANNEK